MVERRELLVACGYRMVQANQIGLALFRALQDGAGEADAEKHLDGAANEGAAGLEEGTWDV